jgi:uncharacterized protein RhaS with RHS repeats
LIYYGYRYYNPVTGRWLGRDPVGEQGGISLYGFIVNEPISNVDFLGLEDADAFGAVGGAGLGTQIVIHGNTALGNGFYMTGTNPDANFRGKSASVLFIYEKNDPRKMYRLDYGLVAKGPSATTANVWHHNLHRVQQKLNLSVANHSVGRGATAAGRAITIYKWGGRAMFAFGVANSALDIYYAEDKQRETIVQVGGWTGAATLGTIGAKGGAWVGGSVGAWFGGGGAVPGAAIGGFLGGLGGGAVGFWGGAKVTRYVYDTYLTPLINEEWVVACESRP